MKHKVIIIGQGYTGRLSIVRSVAEMGCDVTIIALFPHNNFANNVKNKKPLDAYSKYVKRTFFCENYNEDMLINILMEKCTEPDQKPIIIPDNDFSAAAVDNHRNTLKEYFYIPNIKDRQGAVKEWMDKTRQKELASQLGLNVANARLIEVNKRTFMIPEDLNYPCFVKPLVSIVGGKSGLKKCTTKEELSEHINYFLSNHNFSDVKFLAEDFKKIDKEYATVGFSDGKEVIIPGLLELLSIGHGSHFGVAVQGRAFPITGYEEIVDRFKQLVIEIGFIGIFDIDFYDSDGELFFCELNLRFGGSGYVFTKLGVNLPVMMIKSFLGEDISSLNKNIIGEAKYFNERMAMDDWYRGYISLDDYLRLRSESEIKFVADGDDPNPQRLLDFDFRIKRAKKQIKGWLGKR
ncbi:MAG: ATP-grasp domain-containing protein [Bacteroidales bacterium]|nr:ATP-grasp domain-containing protein [Bacteroidales bacterium]